MATRSNPIVCTLSNTQADDRLVEWSDIQRMAVSVELIAAGVRLRLPSNVMEQVNDLADRESQCCAFLNINIIERGDTIDLTVTSPNADGVSVAQLLAGVADK